MTLEGSPPPRVPSMFCVIPHGSSQWPRDWCYPQLAEEEAEAQGPTLGLWAWNSQVVFSSVLALDLNPPTSLQTHGTCIIICITKTQTPPTNKLCSQRPQATLVES